MVLKKNNRIVLKNGSFFPNIGYIEKSFCMEGFLILHNLNDEIIDVVINQNEILSIGKDIILFDDQCEYDITKPLEYSVKSANDSLEEIAADIRDFVNYKLEDDERYISMRDDDGRYPFKRN